MRRRRLTAWRELLPARAPSRGGRKISGDLDQIPAVGASADAMLRLGQSLARSARANRLAPPSPRSGSNIRALQFASETPRNARVKSCNAERRAGARRPAGAARRRIRAAARRVGGPDSVALMLLAARCRRARRRKNRRRDRRPWTAREFPRGGVVRRAMAGALGFEHRLLYWEGRNRRRGCRNRRVRRVMRFYALPRAPLRRNARL